MLNNPMLKNMLTQSFNRASRESGKDCLINYIWINKSPDSQFRHVECTVSFKHIDCAHDVARNYPDARIKIWLDYKFLDKRSVNCLNEHHKRFAPPNVELCDLNIIPQYGRDPDLFGPNANKNIWARVDVARLIVLKHVLKKEPEPYAIYADFDVQDPKLAKAKALMDKNGLALATTGAHINLAHMLVNFLPGILENGYFAFKKDPKGRKFLHTLLSRTFTCATRDSSGYTPFVTLASQWAVKHDTTPKQMAVNRVLFSMGYHIPHQQKYFDWKWN